MRRLGAIVAVAMLLALTVAAPVEAGKPAPAQGPYISNLTGSLRWSLDSEAPYTWWYVLDVSVTAVGLPMKPLYMPCTQVGFDGAEPKSFDQPILQPASRPRSPATSTVVLSFLIPDGGRSVTVTSQLMQLSNRPGCCTAIGALRTGTDVTLQKPPPAHDATPVIFNVDFEP